MSYRVQPKHVLQRRPVLGPYLARREQGDQVIRHTRIVASLIVEVGHWDWRRGRDLLYELSNVAVRSGRVVVGKLMEVDMENLECEDEDVVDDRCGICRKGLEESPPLNGLCENLGGHDP